MSDARGENATAPTGPPGRGRAELERGTCIGRYIIVDQLGTGGMGVVYKAFDPELGRAVALKLLKIRLHNSGALQERLLREAQALARLSHPNVVAVHDVGMVGSDLFVAMEFVQGKTLSQWLRERPRSQREILDVFLAAGAGLMAAHQASLVHRDFKLDNVIVGDEGRVRVLDFGLARETHGDDAAAAGEPSSVAAPATSQPTPAPRSAADDVQAPTVPPRLLPSDLTPDGATPSGSGPRDRLKLSLTADGAVMGSPRFMAPEQHLGQRIDERADQFSFCVSLYSALYDSFPFEGDEPDRYREHVLSGRVQEPPSTTRVPRWLRHVLLRGLAVRPESRWPSMEELLRQLSRDPQRSARRWLYASGALVSVALLTVGALRVQRDRGQVCAGAETKLAAVWDAPRRAAVRTAFLGTDMPFAADALATATATLDAYARDWVAMRTSACEATRVRGEQSEELLDLRMECLDQRAHELGALTELFASADASLVRNSLSAAGGLTSLESCANAAALKAPVRLPSDPVVRAKVEALRERIARGQALWDANRGKAGLELMRAVVDDTKMVHHLPTQGQALLLYGNFQRRAGDLAAAEATLKQALLAAVGGRDDETAARASLALVHTAVDLRPGSADAVASSEQAATWVSRLGSPKLELELERALGALAWGRGEFVEAKRHDQRRVELAEKVFGRDSVDLAKALGDLATDLYLLEQLDEALAYDRRTVEIETKVLGPRHPDLGVTFANMAARYIDLGRLDEAEQVLLRARELLQPVSTPGSPWVGRIQCNLGDVYELEGRYDDALRLERQALVDQKEPDIVATLKNLIGSVLNRQNNFAEALPLHEEALAIEEKAYGGPHPSMAPALLGIGLAHLGLRQPDKAIAPLERANQLANVPARQRGLVRLALAQALDASQRADRVRVRSLLSQARGDLAPTPKLNANEVAQIDRWIARHP